MHLMKSDSRDGNFLEKRWVSSKDIGKSGNGRNWRKCFSLFTRGWGHQFDREHFHSNWEELTWTENRRPPIYGHFHLLNPLSNVTYCSLTHSIEAHIWVIQSHRKTSENKQRACLLELAMMKTFPAEENAQHRIVRAMAVLPLVIVIEMKVRRAGRWD